MERRRSTRIPFKSSAYLVNGDKSVPSEIQNISNKGFYLSTDFECKEGDNTFIFVQFLDGNISTSMTLPCTVARTTETGVGFTSPHLDPETFLFIRNLIHAEEKTPSLFMQSFYGHLNDIELYANN